MKPLTFVSAVALTTAFATSAPAQDNAAVTAALAELAQRQAEDARIATNLRTFDTLDFEVFSNQQWDRLHESHAEDIIVHWPDGRETVGIDVHIEDLKAFFTFRQLNVFFINLNASVRTKSSSFLSAGVHFGGHSVASRGCSLLVSHVSTRCSSAVTSLPSSRANSLPSSGSIALEKKAPLIWAS